MSARLDMNAVVLGLIDAKHAADDLDGLTLATDKASGTRRTEVAEATRALLALADRLDLLAAMVRQEYWLLKGQQRIADRTIADTFDHNLAPYITPGGTA